MSDPFINPLQSLRISVEPEYGALPSRTRVKKIPLTPDETALSFAKSFYAEAPPELLAKATETPVGNRQFCGIYKVEATGAPIDYGRALDYLKTLDDNCAAQFIASVKTPALLGEIILAWWKYGDSARLLSVLGQGFYTADAGRNAVILKTLLDLGEETSEHLAGKLFYYIGNYDRQVQTLNSFAENPAQAALLLHWSDLAASELRADVFAMRKSPEASGMFASLLATIEPEDTPQAEYPESMAGRFSLEQSPTLKTIDYLDQATTSDLAFAFPDPQASFSVKREVLARLADLYAHRDPAALTRHFEEFKRVRVLIDYRFETDAMRNLSLLSLNYAHESQIDAAALRERAKPLCELAWRYINPPYLHRSPQEKIRQELQQARKLREIGHAAALGMEESAAISLINFGIMRNQPELILQGNEILEGLIRTPREYIIRSERIYGTRAPTTATSDSDQYALDQNYWQDTLVWTIENFEFKIWHAQENLRRKRFWFEKY